MSERDNELEKFLNQFRTHSPTSDEVAKWQNATRNASKYSRVRQKRVGFGWYFQVASVATALILGIFMGRVSLNSPVPSDRNGNQNYAELDATFQYSYVKSNPETSEKEL